ncbi:pyridoxal phosphate-dependent transferase [Mycena capillaripes]|nr:pyridoxal phosphate-dependent transferase [Mycena capillaripes]
MSEPRVINVKPVLHEAAKGLLDFNGTGIGIAEISHRSPEFTAFLAEGGGTLQFSAVVYNLLARHRLLHPELLDEERVMDYILTGRFSDSRRRGPATGGGRTENLTIYPLAKPTNFRLIPRYFYCENETADAGAARGDYSSSFMSRPIPHLADCKNIGPAGLTVLIVRNDCLVDVDGCELGAAPTLADNLSVYNTPSVFSIYVAGLCFGDRRRWAVCSTLRRLTKRRRRSLRGHQGRRSKGCCGLESKGSGRSLMNVVFDFEDPGVQARFVLGAEARGIKGIKGHPSEQVDAVVAYMKDFLVQ